VKKYFFIFCFVVFIFSAYGEDELLSAKDLLQKYSDSFKKNVADYEADITWTQDNNVQKGKVYFKNPQKLRINFTEPNRQVICTNGYYLWVYIDYLSLVLKQEILAKEKTKNSDGKIETVVNPILINPMGFDKFLTSYSIEYFETKNVSEYKDGSKVYTLKLLRWRSSKNGFNTVFLTIQDNGIIRKIEGITAAYKKITLEIDNLKLNSKISDLLFNYEPPASANVVDNFISNQGDS
jgi:outer membrane lipoprotein-sorting protein